MTFANLSQTVTKEGVTFDLKISKNVHHQGQTMFCWAFAISSMIRNSLLNFRRNYGQVLNDPALDFHKVLRNEIIMGPVPKAKYFDLKNTTPQRKHEIRMAQAHIVTSAIERVRDLSGRNSYQKLNLYRFSCKSYFICLEQI